MLQLVVLDSRKVVLLSRCFLNRGGHYGMFYCPGGRFQRSV